MAYLGSWKIDDLLTFVCVTQVFATGVATDADSVPAYRVYEDETGTAILTGTMSLLDSANTAGFYSEQITLSAANGFEKGKCYSVYIAATVSSVAGAKCDTFQIQAEVSVASIVAGGITAASIATGAIDADALATDAVAEIADGVWDEDATGHQTTGTFGQAIGDPVADTNTIYGAVVTGAAGATIAVDIIAIQADTDNIQTRLPAALTADGYIKADALKVGGADPATTAETADALLDSADAIEVGLTPRQAWRLQSAATAGKLSGAATTTNTIRNAVADSKNRIVATVDSDGNRTAITYDVT